MRTDVLGVIFSSAGDGLRRELTELRCVGSVPFGGRYRLIDFSLSNMVNAGVSKVGVTTRSNYRSLMDHLGGGKPWDLSRKKGGIFFFPPYIGYGSRQHATRIEEMESLLPFLERSSEEYVVTCDCDCVANLDIEDMVNCHIESGADVTMAYTNGKLPKSEFSNRMVLSFDNDKRVTEILMSPDTNENCDFAINTMVLKKDLFIAIIKDSVSRNFTSVERDVYQRCVDRLVVKGYEVGGFVRIIDSMTSYFSASMELLNRDSRNMLFNGERAIFTKIRDENPAKYGLGSSIKNCLVADGCIIDGEVENCILFRGVKIGKGAKLSNCIVMQDTVVGENAEMSYVITDKDVTVTSGRVLIGFESYPAFIAKGSKV